MILSLILHLVLNVSDNNGIDDNKENKNTTIKNTN